MPENKVKVTASMDADLVKWIDKEIEGRRFASRTHALEVATARLRDEIDGLEGDKKVVGKPKEGFAYVKGSPGSSGTSSSVSLSVGATGETGPY